jgi:hypothetical protein
VNFRRVYIAGGLRLLIGRESRGLPTFVADPNDRTMQQIAFTIGKLLEATFGLIVPLGWLPVSAFSLIMFFGFLYWLKIQGDYNRKARRDGTLA